MLEKSINRCSNCNSLNVSIDICSNQLTCNDCKTSGKEKKSIPIDEFINSQFGDNEIDNLNMPKQ